MGASTLVTLVMQLGLPSALVIFFVVVGERREARLRAELRDLNLFVRDELIGALERAVRAIDWAGLSPVEKAMRRQAAVRARREESDAGG